MWQSALADVHYVDVNSTNATRPYTNWATAATDIQDAVDAAAAGDEVVVTNGTYATGGRAVYGTMTNRVAVDKPLALRSINGTLATIIDGGGSGRCAYLTNGASLSGFTLTNGAASYVSDPPPYRQTSGGGLWCEGTNDVVVSNCVVAGNWSENSGGGAYGGTLNRCTVANNSSADGGGAAQSTLNNCTLVGNEAWGAFSYNYYLSAYGGGAYNCTLNNCALSSNSVSALIFGDYTSPGAGYYSYAYGGGTYGCRLNNCTLSGNSASADSEATTLSTLHYAYAMGGGAADCTLSNCALSGNLASASAGAADSGEAGAEGGGVYGGQLSNCLVTSNSASAAAFGGEFIRLYAYGGAASTCVLTNSTLIDNLASLSGASGLVPFAVSGGGAYAGTLNNCIVYFNKKYVQYSGYYEDDYYLSALNHCWTTNPLFVDYASGNLRLQSNSPCINAGDNSYVTTATDLDGNPRISGGIVDIGAYEFQFNHAPLALANVSPLFAILQGGTNRFILSPNNADATIVLDGSQSSDADNDPLQFFWYADGQPNVLATGALATNLFAVGPHTVQLVVSDGHDTATVQVSFAVITPATAVGQLMLSVDEANLGSRNQQPLLATLSAAMSAFDRGNFKAGVNQLSAFQNQVRAQIVPWDPALAGELITATQRISEVVGGGQNRDQTSKETANLR